MTVLEIRNHVVDALKAYLGIDVILSDQAAPEAPVPFCIYTVTAPYAPTGELGDHSQEEVTDENGDTNIVDIRREQPSMTLSFTFCSENRWKEGPGGAKTYIFGEDEAQEYAERAQGWFLHVAYDSLSNMGIVVADVMNAGGRTTLIIDEAARRYGFDVRIRYTRADKRTDHTVERVTI